MASEEQVIAAVRAYTHTYFTQEQTSTGLLAKLGFKPADEKHWSLNEHERLTISIKDATIEEHPDEHSWIVGVSFEPEIPDPQFFQVEEQDDESLSVQWVW